MLRTWLWITPFLFFLAGYYTLARLMRVRTTTVPAVIGMQLQAGLVALSDAQLYGHILHEQEDAEQPAGTIVDQNPMPYQLVKGRQSVGLVITKQPATLPTPSYTSLPLAMVREKAQAVGIKLKEHLLEHTTTAGTCYAQYPLPNEPLGDHAVHIYVSTGTTPLRIMPDLQGKPLKAVQDWLKEEDIPLHVIPAGDYELEAAIITKQKPLSGTIFDRTKPLQVYVMVEAEPAISPF